MTPPHHYHSLLTSPYLVTHLLLLLLLYIVPTTCFLTSTTTNCPRDLTKRTPRIGGNFIVTTTPIYYSTPTLAPVQKHDMALIFLGVVGGLCFLALCCFGLQYILKAYKRRKVRAASHSINTRRGSTDSIWGIPPEPHSAYPREDRTHDMYPQPKSSSLGTATIQSGVAEKGPVYQAWRGQHIESPGNWGRNESSPVYHESGYTGILPYDPEKGDNYSRETLQPIVPPNNNKVSGGARDTTSAIIEDRFGPSVINRSGMRSSYESYRQTASAAPANPLAAPKSLPMPMV